MPENPKKVACDLHFHWAAENRPQTVHTIFVGRFVDGLWTVVGNLHNHATAARLAVAKLPISLRMHRFPDRAPGLEVHSGPMPMMVCDNRPITVHKPSNDFRRHHIFCRRPSFLLGGRQPSKIWTSCVCRVYNTIHQTQPAKNRISAGRRLLVRLPG
jgi:hypothetical protein